VIPLYAAAERTPEKQDHVATRVSRDSANLAPAATVID
jgi:hypothetical protein